MLLTSYFPTSNTFQVGGLRIRGLRLTSRPRDLFPYLQRRYAVGSG